ncbi:hypothetical protein Tco_0700894 [Tanacetum coccineum]
MTTLPEHIIVAGVENRPPMLEKSMYDSWASRIRLFIKGEKHGRMTLDSIDNGPLVYPTGETLYEYYWIFSQLINDIHTIGMTMQQVQNSAFQTKDLDAYDSDCDDISTAKAVLMENLSSCDSNVLSELNKIQEDFDKRFVTQKELSAEQAFWLKHSNYNPDTSVKSHTHVRIESPSKLSKCSVDKNNLEIKIKQLSIDNDQLLNQIMSQDIVHIAVNSVDICDMNKSCVDECTLKNKLRKLKGKNVVDSAVSKPIATIAPGMFKLDIEPISLRLKNNRDAHEVYLDTLRGFVECARKQNLSEPILESAFMFTKHVQEFLVYVSKTCPNLPKPSEKLVAVAPLNKDKKVRFAKHVTSPSNIPKQTDSRKTKDSNKPLLPSTGVNSTTSASGSKPSGNTKKNRITRPPSSNQKNKVEEHPRKVKSSLNKTNSISEPISFAHVTHSVRNAKFESICAICNKCLFDVNHAMCLFDYVNDVNVRSKSKSKQNKMRKVWKPTKVPLKESTIKLVITPSPELKVYHRKPKASRSVGSSSKAKIVESKSSNTKEPKQSWGSTVSDVPSSSLIDCSKFLGIVEFGNDHIAKIMGYGDYQMGNVTISRGYYVEGLGHNLFSVGQFCDSDLEVAFHKRICFIRDLDGVDLLNGSRGSNLYTLSMDNLFLSSPICLLSKASKTKSWLWH